MFMDSSEHNTPAYAGNHIEQSETQQIQRICEQLHAAELEVLKGEQGDDFFSFAEELRQHIHGTLKNV